jgi:hypothetical protein
MSCTGISLIADGSPAQALSNKQINNEYRLMPFLLNYENAGVSVPLLVGFIRNPNEHDLEPEY